jgi:surface antigen
VIVHADGTGHVGIVLRVSSDGKSLNVIEGNSANKVALRTRVVGAGNHVGYMNYFDDANDSYDFEKGLISTDNSGLGSTR